MASIRHLENRHATCHIAGCCHRANSMACHPRATYHIAGCCHLVNSLSCQIPGCCHLAKSMSWSCHIARCNNSIRYIENRFFAIFYVFVFFKCSLGFNKWQLSYRLFQCWCYLFHCYTLAGDRSYSQLACFCLHVCVYKSLSVQPQSHF